MGLRVTHGNVSVTAPYPHQPPVQEDKEPYLMKPVGWDKKIEAMSKMVKELKRC